MNIVGFERIERQADAAAQVMDNTRYFLIISLIH